MFLKILFIAFVSAVGIGPATLISVKEGLKRGSIYTFYGILGITIVEALYANLAVGGVFLAGKSIYFQLVLYAIGALVFLILSLSGFKKIFAKKLEQEVEKKQIHPFFMGALLTLINPLLLIFWPMAVVSLKVHYNLYFLTLGIFAVGIVWGVLISFLVRVLGRVFTEKFMKILDIITSVVLFLFAARFVMHLVEVVGKKGWF